MGSIDDKIHFSVKVTADGAVRSVLVDGMLATVLAVSPARLDERRR